MTAFRRCPPLGICTLLLAGTLIRVPAFAAVDDLSVSHKQISGTASSLDATLTTDSSKLGTTAIASLNPRTSSFVRLESVWIHDLQNSSASVRVGDTISNPGAWGSAVRFAGLQFGTPFQMRPDLLYSPRLALAGIAIVPTTVEAMFSTTRSPDATISQRGLSLIKTPVFGANGLSFTTRDAVGRTTSFNQTLFPGPRKVEVGCKTYSMSLGRVREDYALAGNNYGPWFANTTITCGADSGLSVEAHGEYLQGEAGIAGVDLSKPVGVIGAASVAVVTSDNDRGTGWSFRVGLQRSGDLFEMNLRALLQSAEFRDLGTDKAAAGIAQRMLASIAAKLGDRKTLALAYAMQRTFALRRTNVVAMTHTIGFGPKGTMSIVANRDVNDDRNSSINLSFAQQLSY